MEVTDNDKYDEFSKSIKFKDKDYAVKISWKQKIILYQKLPTMSITSKIFASQTL